MISKMQIFKSNASEVEQYTGEEYLEEKEIRVLMEEIIKETNISVLCSQEGIDASLYYKWSKDFLEITRSKLVKNNSYNSVESKIIQLRNENMLLSKLVSELQEEIRKLKEKLGNKW